MGMTLRDEQDKHFQDIDRVMRDAKRKLYIAFQSSPDSRVRDLIGSALTDVQDASYMVNHPPR